MAPWAGSCASPRSTSSRPSNTSAGSRSATAQSARRPNVPGIREQHSERPRTPSSRPRRLSYIAESRKPPILVPRNLGRLTTPTASREERACVPALSSHHVFVADYLHDDYLYIYTDGVDVLRSARGRGRRRVHRHRRRRPRTRGAARNGRPQRCNRNQMELQAAIEALTAAGRGYAPIDAWSRSCSPRPCPHASTGGAVRHP